MTPCLHDHAADILKTPFLQAIRAPRAGSLGQPMRRISTGLGLVQAAVQRGEGRRAGVPVGALEIQPVRARLATMQPVGAMSRAPWCGRFWSELGGIGGCSLGLACAALQGLLGCFASARWLCSELPRPRRPAPPPRPQPSLPGTAPQGPRSTPRTSESAAPAQGGSSRSPPWSTTRRTAMSFPSASRKAPRGVSCRAKGHAVEAKISIPLPGASRGKRSCCLW